MKQLWTAFALVIGAAILLSQALEFEVATIKVHSFDGPDSAVPVITGNRFARSGNMKQLLMYAYDLKSYQIAGGPNWVAQPSTNGGYFDIEAIAPGTETLTQPRAKQMLQSLLTKRFHLRTHREMKDSPVYALVVNKGGPKFKESAPDTAPSSRGAVTQSTVASTFVKSTMNDLLRVLNGAADRPVLDQTGLTKMYDFKLEFARDPAAAADASNAASMFTALQEQLGLKLESRRGPIEVLMIDGAERPTEN